MSITFKSFRILILPLLILGLSAQVHANPVTQNPHRRPHDPSQPKLPDLWQMKLTRDFLIFQLRTEALTYVQNLALDQISNATARAALKDMIARDLIEDIYASTYDTTLDSCESIRGQAISGSRLNDLGGEICLSTRDLQPLNANKLEILALVIHEHAQHFGYADAGYEIYNAVYLTAHLANPLWTHDSRPPTPPPADPKAPEAFFMDDIARSRDGKPLRLKFSDAVKYCANQGARLPTLTEWLKYYEKSGALGFRQTTHWGHSTSNPSVVAELEQMALDGFLPALSVNHKNEPAVLFYFNSRGFRQPSGDLGRWKFWTSTATDGRREKSDAIYQVNGRTGEWGATPVNGEGPSHLEDIAVTCAREP